MAPPQLSILMPAFNERETIAAQIERTLAAELPVAERELIVVDDCSTDGTRELLTEGEWPEQVRLQLHDRNAGKGAAVRTALEHAQGTYSVILDADLEYDPADLPRLLQPLIDARAEAVFGSRAFESHSAYGFWYVVGNKTVSMWCNLLYNAWLSDIMTCLKAMPTELFRSLDLRERGFAVEPEITGRLLRAGVRIHEVPISYSARSREEGKKLTARDGVRAIRTLVRCRVT
jgi:glycosyltransferase involved in cell wall biosynthesis